MKTTILILLFSLTVLGYSQTGEKNFIDQNYIEVIGKAEMEVVPDIIDLKIIIDENDVKGKTTLNELEKSMINKLSEFGVDIEKDLAIRDLTSNFKFHILIKTDIILSKEYILTVHNGIKATEVFLELEKIGISNINIEKLDHSEIEKFRKEAKSNSIKAAKMKAEYLTNAIGQNIGRAIYIEELERPISYNQTSNIYIRGASSIYGSKSSNLPNIDFDKIRLEYSVKVRFDLK